MIKNKVFISFITPILVFLFVILVGYKHIALLTTNEYWKSYIFPWMKLWYLIVPFIMTGLAYFLNSKKKIGFYTTVLIISAPLFFLLCSLSKIQGIFISVIVSVGIYIVSFFWGQLFCRGLRLEGSNILIKFLLGTIVYHHLNFLLSSVNFLNKNVLLAILIINLVGGVYYNSKNSFFNFKKYIEKINIKFNLLEFFLLSFLILTMFLAFINASVPQTYTDGIVERLPYLNQLIMHGTFPEHYSKWCLLTPLPMNIILFGSYSVTGDLGASIYLYLFAVVFVFLIYSFLQYLKVTRDINLVVLNLIMTLSPIWILTTVIYFDISIALFCISGLLLFLRSLDEENSIYLYVSFILWGFSVSIKLNAAIFVVSCLLTCIVIERKKLRFILIHLPGIILAFLFSWLPWTIRTTYITGNPLFPFVSFLNRKEFDGANVLTTEAMKAFEFNGEFIKFIRIPWDLVFSTGSFGEYLPGTINPITLILSLLSILLLSFLIKKKVLLKKEYFLLIAGLLSIYITSFFLKATLMRYWLAGLIILLIFMTSVFNKYLLFFDISNKKIKIFIISTLVTFSLAFHLLIGARLNYFLPNGLGDELWFGTIDKDKFMNSYTYGIPEFINSNTNVSEPVLLSNFFFANKIKNPTIFAADDRALFGALRTIGGFESYIKKYNIKYWVVNIETPFAFDQKIKDAYWRDEYISYTSGKYIIYNLNKEIKTSLVSLSDKLNWLDSKGNSSSVFRSKNYGVLCLENIPNSIFLKIEIALEANAENSNLIIQNIKYNKDGIEIDRKLSGRIVKKGVNEIIQFSSLEKETHKICIQVNPWRDEDGYYVINKSKVFFY